MLKLLRRLLLLGIASALVIALWRRVGGPSDPSLTWTPAPVPVPPTSDPTTRAFEPAAVVDAPAAVQPGTEAWIHPDAGACPATHPVKAKLASGIFHLPGGTNYGRTKADRCYADAAAAEADGMRQAKR